MHITHGLHLNLLGPIEITLNGAPVPFRYEKLRALLVYLVVEAQRSQRREALAALFWPETTDANARRNLSQALFNLRQVLGDSPGADAPAYLLVSHEAIQFNADSVHVLDVRRFRGLLSDLDTHAHPAGEACPECQERLEQAAALYRGDFLANLAIGDSPTFEEWVALQREELRLLIVKALDRLLALSERQGALEQAIAYARRLLAIEPWREDSHRHLMRLLALSGQRNAALLQYELCRRRLADELAVEPAHETVALFEQIKAGTLGPRAGAASSVAAALEWVPAVALPRPPAPLFGREADLAAGQQLLLPAEARLVTLTGPGGVGKTRLAVALAESVREIFPDGVTFVDLAALTDARQVPAAVAQAVDGLVTHGTPLTTPLAQVSGSRRLLLVLDNFEHVLPAANWLAALLEATDGLKVVVTSRERLRLRWERTLPVNPLALPDPRQADDLAVLANVPSVALFVDRAQAAAGGFALTSENAQAVAEICVQLDGLPLALELAGARTALLSPAEILQLVGSHLAFLGHGARDLPTRHQTLEAAIAWSYNQLSAVERQYLAQLSVHVGGFSVQTAAQAAPTPGASAEALELLATLIDKSLVQAQSLRGGTTRYSLLKTVREFVGSHYQAQPERPDTAYAPLVRVGQRGLASASAAGRVPQRFDQWHDHRRPTVPALAGA